MGEGRSLFSLLLDEMRIPVSKIRFPVQSMSAFPDMGLSTHLYGDSTPFSETLPNITRGNYDTVKIYLLQDCYLCKYILYADCDSDDQCWILGPYLTEDPTMYGIKALCKKLCLPQNSFSFFQLYYRMLSKLYDKNMLESLIRSEAALRYGDQGVELVSWNMELENVLSASERTSKLPLAYKEFVELNYTVQAKMMECISQGNYPGAMDLCKKLERGGLESKVDSMIRNAKNSLIVLNTLCRVAGYNGGASSEDLDKCAREFVVQIESKTDLQELQKLMKDMIKKYCELVNLKNVSRYSSTIQRVIDHISSSFRSNISLGSIARRFNVSPSYLSTLFKKEIGITFSEYIMEKRLTFAKELLLRTNLPINVIASECGIADNNYFARVFKAKTGVTPAQFRLTNGSVSESETHHKS